MAAASVPSERGARTPASDLEPFVQEPHEPTTPWKRYLHDIGEEAASALDQDDIFGDDGEEMMESSVNSLPTRYTKSSGPIVHCGPVIFETSSYDLPTIIWSIKRLSLIHI